MVNKNIILDVNNIKKFRELSIQNKKNKRYLKRKMLFKKQKLLLRFFKKLRLKKNKKLRKQYLRKIFVKRQIQKRYILNKFINMLNKKGKKPKAYKLLLKSLIHLKLITKESPFYIIFICIKVLKPYVKNIKVQKASKFY